MNKWHQKSSDSLFAQGRFRCLALFAYGHSIEQVSKVIKESFYPDSVIDRLLKILPDLENKKIEVKVPVNLPNVE